MNRLFIHSEKKSFVEVLNKEFLKLPSKLFLAYSIQYKKQAENMKLKLEKLGKKITGFRQVLGCSELKSKEPVLLIGSGRFHALNLSLQGNTLYLLEGETIRRFEDTEANKINSRKKAAKLKFLSSEKIGIIVSSKLGQENLKEAKALETQLKKQGKHVAIFISDNINLADLENYDIDFWVNTACPGLIYDSDKPNMINLIDIKNKN